MPRRRYEGMTAIQVTPAASARAPGTAIRKLHIAALATGVAPSNAARVRSISRRSSISARCRSVGGLS